MKIFMLGWELPPHHVGGMGIVCYQLCKHLANRGVDIDFILPFNADYNIDFMKVNPAVEKSSKLQKLETYPGVYDSTMFALNFEKTETSHISLNALHAKYEEEVMKIVEYGEFDVLHAHDWLTFRAAMKAKAVSGKPLIAHVHSTEYDRAAGGYGNPVVRDIEYHGLMMADRVIAISHHTKKVLVEEYGIPADKISIVHNRMDVVADVHEGDNSYRYLEQLKGAGYKVVVNAGRLTMQKGLTHLLRAMQLVVQKEPKTMLLIAGGGDQYEELIELAADLGISQNVVFTGKLNGTAQNWRDAFRVGDLFVMPSVSEPFGIAAVEAIGYGTPVMVSKTSGAGELITNSLKVDFWDIEKMASTIATAVYNQPLLDELQARAYDEFKTLSWADAAEEIHAVYDDHHARRAVAA